MGNKAGEAAECLNETQILSLVAAPRDQEAHAAGPVPRELGAPLLSEKGGPLSSCPAPAWEAQTPLWTA